MKYIDVIWFSGRTLVGIVKVEDEHEGIKYYIGSPLAVMAMPDEEADIRWIIDWGCHFPKDIGDLMFAK